VGPREVDSESSLLDADAGDGQEGRARATP